MVHQTERNQLSLSEFKVISMVVSTKISSIQTTEKTLQENGENFVLTAVMPLPPAMSLCFLRVLGCGKGSLMVEHFYLNFPWPTWWHTLLHVKFVMDKHLNNHSYPLFKSGHIQRILTIKGNNNNVYLNAVCLPEMRKDQEYKIQMVLSPSAEILYAEDGCPAGRGPTGSWKHVAAFCYALEEFVR